MTAMPPTALTRLGEKAVGDREERNSLIDSARACHVGLLHNGWPVVIPTAVARDGDSIVLHGSTGSRWMRSLAAGARACVTVTSLDGLVVARSAFQSSMHYRSAVIFGTAASATGSEKLRLLDILTDKLLPGRTQEIRGPTTRELASTLVLVMPIEQWSMKSSYKWPEDSPGDLEGPAWAGVIPMHTTYEEPRPAPDLRIGIALPGSVLALRRTAIPNTASTP